MIYLTVTIDVEPDCTPTWHYSNPLGFTGVSTGIKERLHPLFNKYDIIPTYLINNVVMEDTQSVKILKELNGQFELGTHLHPEFIEPEKTIYNYAGVKGEANCCFYPAEIEKDKIKNITALFSDCFGYNPVSFRAGRFSAGANTYKALMETGYKVDTSVTPHICWNDKTREYPVDCTSMPEQPFFITSELLEVPISIIQTRHFSFKEIIKSIFGIRREINFNKNLWLRPIYSSYKELIEVSNIIFSEYKDKKPVVLNMMFHNVEVIPSLSPYTITENHCRRYLKTLELFFIFCKEMGIESVGLSGLYEKLNKERFRVF